MTVLGFKRLVHESRATEVAEAALVLPIVFMLLLGIYWFGRALNTYETINHAALEAARLTAMHPCATCPFGNGPLGANVDLAGATVQQVLQASGLDPAQAAPISAETVPACGPGGGSATCNVPSSGTPNICVYTNVLLNSTPSSAASLCGVSVSFQYPYQFYFPFTSLNLQQLELKARVQMRAED